MIDSGASISFMHQSLAQQHHFTIAPHHLDVSLADGSIHRSEHATRLVMQSSESHFEVQAFQLITLGNYPIILGMDWLRRHNPSIDWKEGVVTLDCAKAHRHSTLPAPALASMPRTLPNFHNSPRPNTFSPYKSITGPTRPQTLSTPQPDSLSTIEVSLITSEAFQQLAKDDETQVYMLDVSELADLATIDTNTPQKPKLPTKYEDFRDVFSKQEADKLPPHRPYDHVIPIRDGAEVPYGPVYSLSQKEIEALHDYIKDNLDKGFIRRSESPAGAPILFVKKKDGSLRLCVDYRGLNKITVPNRCPLPLIPETFDRLSRAKRFTKLDMRGAYNLLRIAEGEEWKTAFRCRYGHYEYRVMPFGLMNAPASFQSFVNDVFRDDLDNIMVAYQDDLLIYTEEDDDEAHTCDVRKILGKAREAKLSFKLEKCSFDQSSVDFLGFVISTQGIAMDPSRVQSIKEWTTPRSALDIQVFLGLANFYRRFVKDFSKIATPLTALLKKNVKFTWNTSAQAAFDELKSRLTSAPILRHFDHTKPCVIETDASDFALGAVCSQYDENDILHPIAYYSRKLLSSEVNYQIYDKELLAIVAAFKHWRHYLEFSTHSTEVLTDHRNLEYFMTTRNLSRRQVRWSETLSDFNFVIKYRPGSQNRAADALSRKDRPVGEGTTPFSKTTMTLLPPIRFANVIQALPLEPESEDITTMIKELIQEDEHFGPLYKEASTNPDACPEYTIRDGLLLYDGLVCVPASDEIKRHILEECHDSPAAGHFGIAKTHDLVGRTFHWPSMRSFVKRYVSGCDTCQRSKSSRHKPYGLLSPLPVPDKPWSSISVDFITQLPESNGYTAICVFVDRFTKMAHFVPTTDNVTAEGTVQLFMDRVFASHGLPDDVVSDRGVTFTSSFTQGIFKALNIEQNLSTAYHPQTDGQTERVNSILEQYLRCYVNYQQTNWSSLLPMAEFSYNNATHSSTATTPFYANLGYHPRFTVRMPRVSKNNRPLADRIQAMKDLHSEMKFHIETAIETHARYYDTKVCPQPDFNIGDSVWLDARHLRTDRPSKKLDYKRTGPYKIIERVNNRSFRLQLPPSMKVHPVFHVSLLERHSPDTIPGRTIEPPPPIIVGGEPEYEVEEILNSRIEKGKLWYRVHWKGYPKSDRSWEPASFINNCPDLLRSFHEENPSKPGPLGDRP
jgi:transposase InsO family protein